MLRRKRGGLGRYVEAENEDINPMDGMGNLSDAMLVLAVGMMLAMLTHWNVDITQPGAVEELENTQTLSEEEVQEVEANESLEELGVVYQDPDTGKFYVRVEE